ncbi:MAG: UPF0280 family protein [Deltaproteobacteria bacterium]|nr:MAG: UPF0280 family protein [Deltaproteobacteria bacterium]
MICSDVRAYRRKARAPGLVSFRVQVRETDLWVSAGVNLEKETRDRVFQCRRQIEAYIRDHPDFVTTLSPYRRDPFAPPLVKEMIRVTGPLGVGPMASVAGAIAQCVGTGLLDLTPQVIVENGGDVFLRADRPVTVSIFAGKSPLSGRFGILIREKDMPLGICSSSASIGHSLSMGIADAACILSPSAALADAAATALGNRVRRKRDLSAAADWASRVAGVSGGVLIVQDRMATWGAVELVEI